MLKEGDDKQETSDSTMKPVAGTNLRCLEDPVFEFDRKKESTLPTTTMTATAPGQHSYHDREDLSPQKSGTGYHVLEAPAISPTSSQRSAATDVLEMARNRFDKFWGKGPEN